MLKAWKLCLMMRYVGSDGQEVEVSRRSIWYAIAMSLKLILRQAEKIKQVSAQVSTCHCQGGNVILT